MCISESIWSHSIVGAVVLYKSSDFVIWIWSSNFLELYNSFQFLLSHSTTCMSSKYLIYASHGRSGDTDITWWHACMIHWSSASQIKWCGSAGDWSLHAIWWPLMSPSNLVLGALKIWGRGGYQTTMILISYTGDWLYNLCWGSLANKKRLLFPWLFRCMWVWVGSHQHYELGHGCEEPCHRVMYKVPIYLHR